MRCIHFSGRRLISRRPANTPSSFTPAISGAIESEATDIATVLEETLDARVSERQGRISDGEDGGCWLKTSVYGCPSFDIGQAFCRAAGHPID